MSRIQARRAAIAMSGAALTFLLVPACSSTGQERVEAGAPANTGAEAQGRTSAAGDETPVTIPPEPVAIEDVFGIEGTRPVVNAANLSERGFVRNADVVPLPGEEAYSVVEVYDATGAHIAYWGNGAGWLSKQVVESPTFRLEDYQTP